MLEKLPSEIRLIISRNYTEALWDFTRMLELINEKLKDREQCILSDHLEKGEANDHFTEYAGSASLSAGTDRKLKGKYQFSRKYIFCKGDQWSDKCNITDPQAREECLKNNKFCFQCFTKDHTSRNCKKEKTGFYCQGSYNSVIMPKMKQGKCKSKHSNRD